VSSYSCTLSATVSVLDRARAVLRFTPEGSAYRSTLDATALSEVSSRIPERRAELDVLEEQLVRQLAEVRAERDELAVAEKVLARFDRPAPPEPPVSTPVSAQVSRPLIGRSASGWVWTSRSEASFESARFLARALIT
jgi:hypothetical protein